MLADPELHADALANRILELAGQQLESSPRELLTRLLAAIEEQSQQMVAHDDPGALGPAGADARAGLAGRRSATAWAPPRSAPSERAG